VANLIALILGALALLTAIFAPAVVRGVLAPGFAADPAKEALTIALLRLMLPSAVIFGLSGLIMAILNSHQIFLIPALTPSMYQLGLIFGTLVLAPRWGIYGLGWGVLLGASLHLALQLPALARLGGRYWPILGLRLASVRQVMRLMGPRLLGVAVVQLNFWVNVALASHMPEGSVTGVALAFALMLMPQAAIAQSIAIAALPTFSAQVAQGRLSDLRDSLATGLRWVTLLAIPATVGLVLLRTPLVTLLYQRGSFTAASTQLVSWALLWYAVGLLGHSLVEVLARAFYALHDTKTPVFVGAAAMTLNIGLSWLLAASFTRLGWAPHGGLALANSIATALEAVGLAVLMRRRLGGLALRPWLTAAAQASAAAALMGAALGFWLGRSGLGAAGATLGGIALGGAVFGLTSWLLGVTEVRRAAVWLGGRLRRTS
jgi:putative peptidoglycan lipid II flippase